MNYGKFFRLNKHLSRIEDGFAIYDYIDLPAYFTPSKDNLMSPKYPISVMIMGDSVAFKLHYSAYKIEKVSKQDAQDKSIKGYSNYPQYIYNIEAPSLISENKIKGGDTTKIVHMEEIILELPFTDTVGRSLSDTIRDIYDTQFPLVQRDNSKDSNLPSKEKSSGGRYLEKLIRTRYLEEKVDEVKDVNSHFYESLRKISDGTTSYSTLWLMGLVKGDKNDVRYRRTDKKGNVIGFLRKLLLDFMFDLKHSDVFQNSNNYQKMFSGMMSDFYFSALMHKCEYYYYRELTTQALKKTSLDNIKDSDRIRNLYAEELFHSEQLWAMDIMSSQAEKFFPHKYHVNNNTKWYNNLSYYRKALKDTILSSINETTTLRRWQDWFADPEEEMRRVCFATKDPDTEEIHICNSDTLIKCLNFKDNQSIIDSYEQTKENISQWFLKRYDFTDVIHLHICKIPLLPTIIVFLSIFMWFILDTTLYDWIEKIRTHIPIFKTLNISLTIVCFLTLLYSLYLDHKTSKLQKMKEDGSKILYICRKNAITNRYIVLFAYIEIVFLFLISLNKHNVYYFLGGIICLFAIMRALNQRFISLSSMSHLFLPRLVASITTAWITISTGFDPLISFADKPISWPFAAIILSIVFLFTMYGIKRSTPRSNPHKIISRSITMLVISYLISLLVGIIIIDFVGERYMERGGFITEFYEQYVDNTKNPHFTRELIRKESKTNEQILWNTTNVDSTNKICSVSCHTVTHKDSIILLKELVDKLATVYHTDSIGRPNYPIARRVSLLGFKFFILRDFLIMFSFVAMFIGIFLQMVLFEEKQMTEL